MTPIDHILIWAYMLFVVAPPLMFLLYVVGIQYQAGGVCKWLGFVTAIAWVLDLLLNYTALVVYTDFDRPQHALREFTFSQRMPRLIAAGGTVGWLCLMLAHALNALAPKIHIDLAPSQSAP